MKKDALAKIQSLVTPSPTGTYRDLLKLVASDIGKATAAYIEVMYPEAVKATSSTFLLSVRNTVHNEIMAMFETANEADLLRRLPERERFRREWKAAYRRIRATKIPENGHL